LLVDAVLLELDLPATWAAIVADTEDLVVVLAGLEVVTEAGFDRDADGIAVTSTGAVGFT